MKAANDTVDIRQHILDTAHGMMSGRGFTAVGLNDLLTAAGVPKGSFYHYFKSKEGFGEELLRRYFDDYLAAMDETFGAERQTGRERLVAYWRHWLETQVTHDARSKCLVVKLAAEVADLSEGMRGVLLAGTARIIERIRLGIVAAAADGSLVVEDDPARLAETLYQTWLGASLLQKITRNDAPLQAAMATTQRALGQVGA
ncbi:TetR/AcrR family transcriptional regulator [Rhizobium halophytocola]|uniref:TetR/AcrR family transcriptional repressor of nem operon n=1 Tax=Rhizobium halophytocola TaxID=735519 RepID=A0ABS4DWV9_9HYPH|nr:TetR/AcrR family transcriptional regulator [Rhizobium halophytocola]MBP1850181.1 TetR/AcrR family transcriptional repressor of nem operon [Rhizobium halophytocola]